MWNYWLTIVISIFLIKFHNVRNPYNILGKWTSILIGKLNILFSTGENEDISSAKDNAKSVFQFPPPHYVCGRSFSLPSHSVPCFRWEENPAQDTYKVNGVSLTAQEYFLLKKDIFDPIAVSANDFKSPGRLRIASADL